MKEININIEGYNVNGICVGCLNYNRKMFYRNDIQECFKILADIDVPDGLSIQVCWECLAAVTAVIRFRDQITQAYDVLIEYSRKHTFLNSPQDLTQYSVKRLSLASPLTVTDLIEKSDRTQYEDDQLKSEIKSDPDSLDVLDVSKDIDNMDDEIKTDLDKDDLKIEYEPDIEEPLDDVPDANSWSDDDVQLSKLKKKKEKRGRKSKKEKKRDKSKMKDELKQELSTITTTTKVNRKLKNLPEDLVKLHFMSEVEMWQIRSEDLASEVFRKLKYKCEDCIIGFNTEKLSIDHRNGKHRQKTPDCLQCDVCKAYLLTKDNLSTHRGHHRAAFACVACGFRTTLKQIMAQHARAHAAGGVACQPCGKRFTSKSKLSYHKSICHQERPQCDCCGKVFANKMTLKYHLKILPQNKDDKPKEKLYIPCKGCDKVFHSKKSYRAHVVIHDGLTYPCPICGKLFQWKRNLSRHTRNHRDRDAGALHECRECGKTFSSRDCYNNHMRLSKRHVPYDALGHECHYCGKKFATKWCMVDHIDWDHLKKIKYQCSVCFKPFKTAKIMVAHMNNIHDGKRNKEPEGEHLCEICGKSYKTVKRLKGHVWAMHTNRSTSKNFKCKLCPATFTWQTSIYKHTKMMHSTGKRGKQPSRQMPAVKKQDPYQDMEATRLPYFPITQDMAHIQQPVLLQNLHNINMTQ